MKRLKINIITRVTRPQNLLQIQKSLFRSIPEEVEPRWILIFDAAKVQNLDTETLLQLDPDRTQLQFTKCGSWKCQFEKVNEMLTTDTQLEGLVYLLDDDNILHPDFYSRVVSVWKENPDFEVLVFSQKVNGKDFTGLDIRLAGPENIKIGGIDLAQYLFKSDVPNRFGVKFGSGYCGDGEFVVDLFKSDPRPNFQFIDEVLCYYNFISQ